MMLGLTMDIFVETLSIIIFISQVMSNHSDLVWIRDGIIIISVTYFNLPRPSKDFLPLLVDLSCPSALVNIPNTGLCPGLKKLNCSRQNCNKMLPRQNITKAKWYQGRTLQGKLEQAKFYQGKMWQGKV